LTEHYTAVNEPSSTSKTSILGNGWHTGFFQTHFDAYDKFLWLRRYRFFVMTALLLSFVMNGYISIWVWNKDSDCKAERKMKIY